MSEPIVELHNVKKTFDTGHCELNVLKNIHVSLNKGEIVSMEGVSGAGKTTLLQIIGGIDKPSKGSVRVKGKELSEYTPRQMARFRNRHIGFLFQFHHLLPDFTAVENIMMPGLIYGKSMRECEQRACVLLKEIDLLHRKNHFPSELSGGECQRIALARALFNNQTLILADEPTGCLDQKNSENLMNLLQQANAQFGQTFLIVTHNKKISRMAHRTIFIVDGVIDRDDQGKRY